MLLLDAVRPNENTPSSDSDELVSFHSVSMVESHLIGTLLLTSEFYMENIEFCKVLH